MEEHRYDWTPLVKSAVSKVMEGQTILMVTDEDSRWFSRYVSTKINSLQSGRPLLSCYSLLSVFPNLPTINSTQDIEIIEDMLDISYPHGYFIWYIGRGDHPFSKLVFRNDENFMWVIDEQMPNSFTLRSSDPLLDIKLLQLYKLFNLTIEAVLFSELDLEL